ncbi:MAG TPA: PQQ-binding-like beta-propeller repeat protein [Pyrinomonadaceae bacterium]|nr:PQQ-binding-like beta-propeller repeat protein [Pyrinomonadaceae bacterium]
MKSEGRRGAVRLFVRVAALALVSGAVCVAARAQGSWEQWGGPTRDFAVKTKGLAAAWPEKGPRQLWKRELGEGYSAVVSDGATLYTMYSRGTQEVVVALAPDTGKTVWEHVYEAETAGMNFEFGRGPHSTPLVSAGRLFAVGSTGKMHALDLKTGKVAWSHDLWKEYGGTRMERGYSCSPVAYKGHVIVFVGGRGQAVMAFDQRDGKVAWKRQDLELSPNSPLIINVGGQDQLVAFMAAQVVGLDPANGDLLWSHAHPTDFGLNMSTPVWGGDGLLFISSAYSGGSRVLKLERGRDGKTTPAEVWFHRRLRVHHGNAVRIGDHVYGSSGDFGPSFVAAVDVKTGKILWQDRSFSKANFVLADGRLIILDEDGHLALADASPAGLKVISKVPLLEKTAWTVPTLVGTKLYVRDRRSIVAVELG